MEYIKVDQYNGNTFAQKCDLLGPILGDYQEYVIEMQRNTLRDTKARFNSTGQVSRTKLQQVLSLAKRTVPALELNYEKAVEAHLEARAEYDKELAEHKRICDGMIEQRRLEKEEIERRRAAGDLIDEWTDAPLKFPPTPDDTRLRDYEERVKFRRQRRDWLMNAILQGEDLLFFAEEKFQEWKKTARKGNIRIVEQLSGV
jgi:hypothetical protein